MLLSRGPVHPGPPENDLPGNRPARARVHRVGISPKSDFRLLRNMDLGAEPDRPSEDGPSVPAVEATLAGMLTPADEQAAEGRRAGQLSRPLSDRPAHLGGELRRVWRAGWHLGHEEAQAWHVQWEAGVRTYGRGAPRRAA